MKYYLYIFAAALIQLSLSALMSIDLGTEFVKIGILKSGSGFDIANNFGGKRKTEHAVAFKKADRLFGNDGLALLGKQPDSAFTYIPTLLGLNMSSSIILNPKQPLSGLKYFQNESESGLSLSYSSPPSSVNVIHLQAMFLDHLRDVGEYASNSKITNTIIAIPSDTSPYARQALKDACAIAGLNAVSFVAGPRAAGVKYQLSHPSTSFTDYSNMTHNEPLIIVDIGSSYAQLSLVTHHSSQTTRHVFTCPISTTTQLISGRAVDDVILQSIQVNTAFAFKSARRCKESLSLSKSSTIQVSDDKVIQYSLAEFEADLSLSVVVHLNDWLNAVKPDIIQFMQMESELKANSSANSSVVNLNVELIGGVTRIPILRQVISDFFTSLSNSNLSLSVGTHMNSDESVALGALNLLASSSSLISLPYTIKLITIEPNIIDIDFNLVTDTDDNDDSSHQNKKNIQFKSLVHSSKKVLNLNYTADFNVTASWAGAKFHYLVTGLSEISNSNLSKVSLTVGINEFGLLDLYSAFVNVTDADLNSTVVELNIEDVTSQFHSNYPLPSLLIRQYKHELENFNFKLKQKKLLEKAKSEFESEIYSIRSILRDSDEYSSFTNPIESESILSLVSELEDWIVFGDGSDSNSMSEIQSELSKITKPFQRIANRKIQSIARSELNAELPIKLLELEMIIDSFTSVEDMLKSKLQLNEFRQSVNKKMKDQAELKPTDDALFDVEDIEKELKVLKKKIEKLKGKQKSIVIEPVATEGDEETTDEAETVEIEVDEEESAGIQDDL